MTLLAKPFIWLPRAARYRAFWLGLPLLLYLWTLGGPFLFDDLHLLLKAERYIAGESPRLDLFRFAPTEDDWQKLRDRGTYPWWAPETQRIDLFRPLAEWSFVLDVRLFKRNTFGHRLVSLAWFAVALLCIRQLYSIVSGNADRANVAAFLFGISQTATQPVSFISNRSDLLVLVGTTLAAWAYMRADSSLTQAVPNANSPWQNCGTGVSPVFSHRPEACATGGLGIGSRPFFNVRIVVLAAVAFVFALLSKEVAVAFAGVIVIQEIRILRRRPRATAAPVRTAIACIVVLLAAAYLAYYITSRPWHLGLTEHAGAQTVLLANAAEALPLYLAVWTLGFPISVLLRAAAGIVAVVALAGIAAAVIVTPYIRTAARTDRAVTFFVVWAVMFMLPALLTNPETRVLCLATVGWAYLLACLLVPRSQTARVTPLWLRHGLFATNTTVSIIAAVCTVVLSNKAERLAMHSLREYTSVQQTPLRDGDSLIVVEARSPLEFICAGDRLEFLTGIRDSSLAFLTSPGTLAEIQREDDRTLLVTASSRPLLGSPTHRLLLGPDWKPRQGQTFTHRDFVAEIAAVAPNDTVTAMRFRFTRPLASPHLHFYPPSLVAETDGVTPAASPQRAEEPAHRQEPG